MELLINGAVSGLGIQGIQIGKILESHVKAISGTHQSEYLKSFGADVVFDYNQTKIYSKCYF
jgi:NADPH:quinone reductase-like Zn-dependent oxidoreductase